MVDCSDKENKELCADEKVGEFPTIRLYRGKISYSFNQSGEIRHFESYHGSRFAEDLAEFTIRLYRLEKDTTHSDTKNPRRRFGFDFDEDGMHESTVRSSGCTIEGRIRVAKVPGELYFSLHSFGQTIDKELINSTHVINHFSFGDYVPSNSNTKYVPKKFKKAWAIAAKDAGEKFAGGIMLDEKDEIFFSRENFTTHEHHVSVVQRSYVPITSTTPSSSSEALSVSEYTFSSNKFKIAPIMEHESH